MRMVVCVKVTPKAEQVRLDPITKTLIREGVESELNPADKNALEMALSLKDKHGGEVVVLSMGPPAFEPYLKLAVAMGADDAILLSDRAFAGADTYPTSFTLAMGIKKLGHVDIIFCGEGSSDAGTNQVPPGIAEWLGIPQITFVSSVEVLDGKVRARRTVKGGYEVLEAPLPVLISVELGCNTPRFPDFRRKRWAEREFKLKVWGKEELGVSEEQVGIKASYTTVKELKEAKTRERKRELIKGSPEEVAERLLEIIRQYL